MQPKRAIGITQRQTTAASDVTMARCTYFHKAMCSLDTLIIDLKALEEGHTHREYDLTNDYFSAVGGSEVSQGHVHAAVDVHRIGHLFDIALSIEGQAIVPCDLCLDDMEQDVKGQTRFTAQIGSSPAEDETDDSETIVVDEADGTLDLAWRIYETIALAIPTRHVHPDGACNPQMLAALASHSAGGKQTEVKADPRWSALEKLRKQ